MMAGVSIQSTIPYALQAIIMAGVSIQSTIPYALRAMTSNNAIECYGINTP